MKAFLLIADSARAHPDGTFSLLRGGINRVQTPRNEPIQFRGSVVARITANLTEVGPHDFRVRIVNEDGQTIVPDITGGFAITEGEGAARAAQVVADFAFILPRYGRYTFAISVDRQELDTYEVQAVEAARPQTQAR